MKNMAELLNEKVIQKRSAVCVGLDPILEKIPECYKREYRGYADEFEAAGRILLAFNKDIIDCVAELAPVVKPQMAFYEQYGVAGIQPFIDACYKYTKGIFVLVRTSNDSAGEIQDCRNAKGDTLSVQIARTIRKIAESYDAESPYSPVGAVVGATYPEEAKRLRELMSKSIFLVPGYGAQGGAARDVVNCFNEDGLGAVVSASRSIIYAYLEHESADSCSREAYQKAVICATEKMSRNIYKELSGKKSKMRY